MISSRPKPSPGRCRRIAFSLICALGFALCTVSAGTQSPAQQQQSDDKGIATKNSAEAFQTGSTQAAKGAEPGQPTAPKPDTALSILVLPKPLPAEITGGI